MTWDGTERRRGYREAQRSLTCLEEALLRDDLSETDKIILKALRSFITDQWLPHLNIADKRIEQMDLIAQQNGEMYSTAKRAEVWMDGACWVTKKGIPGLLALGGLIWFIGHHGGRLGFW